MARIIVVTSGKGGVGKTTSSAAIATGLAQKGKKKSPGRSSLSHQHPSNHHQLLIRSQKRE